MLDLYKVETNNYHTTFIYETDNYAYIRYEIDNVIDSYLFDSPYVIDLEASMSTYIDGHVHVSLDYYPYYL